MKQVKSKITGDIGELDFDSKEGIFIVIYYDLHTKATIKNYYKNLEDLCEWWEDYEEPKDKDFWFFDEEGIIRDTKEENWPEESVAAAKEIGNYFETKEEAEKAVEKLKAWKRLKDRGFKVDLWDYDGNNYQERIITGRILFRVKDDKENDTDLDLLFGGEE